MKKNSSTLFILGSLIVILDSFNAGQALVAFVLTGIIPGTNIAVSPTFMLMLYALIAGFAFSRLFAALKQAPKQIALR